MTQPPPRDDRTDAPADEAAPGTESTRGPQTRTPWFEARNADRYQRQAIIKDIRARSGRWLICYVSGRDCMIDESDTIGFVELLHIIRPGESIDLLLHTAGGSSDAAEKLIRIVRSRVGEAEIRVIVPDFAKSAGTLMVLGADCVVMSDMSELGPIDPQMQFTDSNGQYRWQSVQNYLDAYIEHSEALKQNPEDIPARMMLGRLDPVTVKLCQAARDRARQSAEKQLRDGMFRGGGNITQTAGGLLDTKRWLSHSQMISWEDAQHPDIGLTVEYLKPQSAEWQEYWRLYCLQRLAVDDRQKLYESDYASLIIDGPSD